MNTGFESDDRGAAPRAWAVAELLRAMADALSARFNPVTVQGELASVTRAASGHWYFSLKDADRGADGLLRCAMFRRVAGLLDFAPRDGDLVEVRGRLDVYGPRGDLQLIVEHLRRAGQGTLFEEFMRLKARLEAAGLFDAARKRPVPRMPRAIGVVTSLGAAALHDVATALQRRVPHIPVWLAPASVQGTQAPGELIEALSRVVGMDGVDVVLLVRGGGAMEDLWAFNGEALARAIVACPVPVISGVGHETDFTIADFCADLRAPTPTAAAELCAAPRDDLMAELQGLQDGLTGAIDHRIDRDGQRLDDLARRLWRPSHVVARQQQVLEQRRQALRFALERATVRASRRLDALGARLTALNPQAALSRGYALLTDAEGRLLASAADVAPGQAFVATLADGTVEAQAQAVHLQSSLQSAHPDTPI